MFTEVFIGIKPKSIWYSLIVEKELSIDRALALAASVLLADS